MIDQQCKKQDGSADSRSLDEPVKFFKSLDCANERLMSGRAGNDRPRHVGEGDEHSADWNDSGKQDSDHEESFPVCFLYHHLANAANDAAQTGAKRLFVLASICLVMAPFLPVVESWGSGRPLPQGS